MEVFSESRAKAFYISAKYRTPSGRTEDDFIVRRARMTLTGFGRFDLAYFRHTDRWFTVFLGSLPPNALITSRATRSSGQCEPTFLFFPGQATGLTSDHRRRPL